MYIKNYGHYIYYSIYLGINLLLIHLFYKIIPVSDTSHYRKGISLEFMGACFIAFAASLTFTLLSNAKHAEKVYPDSTNFIYLRKKNYQKIVILGLVSGIFMYLYYSSLYVKYDDFFEKRQVDTTYYPLLCTIYYYLGFFMVKPFDKNVN